MINNLYLKIKREVLNPGDHDRKHPVLYSLLVCALFIASIPVVSQLDPGRFYIHLNVSPSSQPEVLQIFIDTGRGFNEKESVVVYTEEGGPDRELSFKLPPFDVKNLRRIRLDTGSTNSEISIKSLKFEYFYYVTGRRYDVFKLEGKYLQKTFSPINQIKSFLLDKGRLTIKSAGNDPYSISKGNIFDLYIKSNPFYSQFERFNFLSLCLKLLVNLSLILLGITLFKKRRSIRKKIQILASTFHLNPNQVKYPPLILLFVATTIYFLNGHPLFNHIIQSEWLWVPNWIWLFWGIMISLVTAIYFTNLFIFILALCSIQLSLIQSSYSYDPHHWGLMFSQALNILGGGAINPYYGVLPQYLNAFGLFIFGQTLDVLGGYIGFFYALGLYFIYQLWRIILPKKIAFGLVIVLFFLHSHIIYPWSNYQAFAFLVVGLYFYLKDYTLENRKIKLVLAGIFFSLSVLTRDLLWVGYFVAFAYLAIIGISRFFIFDLVSRYTFDDLIKKIVVPNFLLASGFLGPIILVIIYFSINGELLSALEFSKRIKIYHAKMFFGDTPVYQIPFALLSWLFANLDPRVADPRKFIFSLSFFLNMGVVLSETVKSLTNKKRDSRQYPVFTIAVFSLTMHVASLHSAEVFRLATSTSIGFGSALYFLAGNIQFRSIRLNLKPLRLPLIGILYFVGTFSSGFFFGGSSSNYYPVPTKPLPKSLALNETKLPHFTEQRWRDPINQFYLSYYKTILNINKKTACHLTHFFNPTGDGFLAVLSPVPSLYQVPWLHDTLALISVVNPDYIRLKEDGLKNHSLLLLSKTAINPPEGYVLINTVKKDFIQRYTHFKDLLIYGPEECVQ